MTDFSRILYDIASLPVSEIPRWGDLDITQERLTAGPSQWALIKEQPAAFGPEEDFFIHRDGDRTVFCPVSKAALHWCYAHLPEDCPRYGATGFIIDAGLDTILQGARRDGLMSDEDFTDAMEEAHNLSRQWED